MNGSMVEVPLGCVEGRASKLEAERSRKDGRGRGAPPGKETRRGIDVGELFSFKDKMIRE